MTKRNRRRVPATIKFWTCIYDGNTGDGVRLRLTTDHDEAVTVEVPFDSLHCVVASMRKGLDARRQQLEWCSRALEQNAKGVQP